MYEPAAKLPVDALEPCPGLWNDCSAPGGKLKPRPSCSVKIKVPGLTSGAGGEIRASDAAMFWASPPLLLVLCCRFEVGAWMDGVVEPEGDFAGASVVMVDCEEDREKVLARGARCVSFNSVLGQRCEVEIERCRPGCGPVRAGAAGTYSW